MHIKQERKCVACRECKPQQKMLRIARINNEYVLDLNQKLGGRGAYVCKNKSCIDLCVKKRLLNKSFKSNLNQQIYENLGAYEQDN